LSASRLSTMIACTRSSADGSVFGLRGARGCFGPAAAAFLRGVPGVFATSANVAAGLGGRRLAGGLAFGSMVGFLAI
jgi:hypothetical protein